MAERKRQRREAASSREVNDDYTSKNIPQPSDARSTKLLESLRRTSATQTLETLAPSENPFENATSSGTATSLPTSPQASTSTTTMAQRLLFISYNHPDESKDRNVLRAARTHTMQNFLGQKRLADPQPRAEPRRIRRHIWLDESEMTFREGLLGMQGSSMAAGESILDRETALSTYRQPVRNNKKQVGQDKPQTTLKLSPSASARDDRSLGVLSMKLDELSAIVPK